MSCYIFSYFRAFLGACIVALVWWFLLVFLPSFRLSPSSSSTITTMLLLHSSQAPNFYPLSPEQSAEDSSQGNTDPTPESKAAQRRAQVRRAQIQHRQRKANYVKELEKEVAKIRQQIEDVDKERRVLRVENEGMKTQLRLRNGLAPQQPAHHPTPPTQPQQPQQGVAEPWYMSDEMDFTMTMQLGYDEVLGAPCYMVSGLSSPGFQPVTTLGTVTTATALLSTPGGMLPTPPTTATFAPTPTSNNSHITTTATPQPEDTPELPYMTPPQIQTAINFILALEHTCRTHFHPSHFSPSSSSSSSPSPSPPILSLHSSHGHALMATSLALQSAPLSVFSAAKKTQLFPGSSINLKPPPPTSDELLQWESSALTLKNLYRLSKVMEKEGEDEQEATPVRAWFEMVGRYGLERVMGKVGELKGELGRRKRGTVVRCPHFGARLDKGGWEGVVERVMGGG
ncbi:hypothetical protein QBC41DRAFT_221860 [Cercophora samala]|uniref:Putative transcription factor kapC n=1 Tax=Cercophora samala TaxID=330535 RepID=A0AA39ZG52_9PEZI|nr:hypothetical protein QBC41DRAFT_221860 [Cercophora samala]